MTLTPFISQTCNPETACNLAASVDHPPELQPHRLPHLTPEWGQAQRDVVFQSFLGHTWTIPLISREGCTIGTSPVEKSCLKAIGPFIATHGSSIPLFSLQSNKGRLSQHLRRISRHTSPVFRRCWKISPPSHPPVTSAPTALQLPSSSLSQTPRKFKPSSSNTFYVGQLPRLSAITPPRPSDLTG